MDEGHERSIAELRAALQQGIITENTYRIALSGLDPTGRYSATADHSAVAQGSSTAVGERGANAGDVEGSIVTGNNNSVTHITTIYQQAHGRAQLDTEAFQAALGRYLHWVEKRYGRLDLRGVDPREQNPLTLTLDDVYVSLSASVTPRREERFRLRPEEMEKQETKPIDMSRLLALGPRLIIIGGPGSGKTTFLRLIAATLARVIRLGDTVTTQGSLGLAEPLPLPIFISLSDFNRYRREFGESADPRQGTLMAFISHDLIHKQAVRGLPADFFERLLDGGQGVMLLLDGLDEVADERERVLVSRAVEHLAFNDGVGRVIVTSRTRAYYGDVALAEEYRLAAVRSMTPEQVDALADRWCRAVYLDEMAAAAESAKLRQAIRELEERRAARGDQPLADNPLIVTIIAIIHYNERRLPEQRAELYSKCVDVLLAEKHHQQVTEAHYELVDWGGKLADKRKWLAYLAYRMMDAGAEAGRAVDERTLGEWLRPRLATSVGEAEVDQQVHAFCMAMRERGSLLAERGGLYQFTHLTFQEYLGATYLADVVSDTEHIVGYLTEDNRLADAWWRETVLLLAGYLGLRSDEQALRLLQRLATVEPDGAAALAAAELAGAAFVELDNQDATVKDTIVNRLVALVTDPKLEARMILRMLAGDTLGRLGDPRMGVLTLEPDLIAIPAGPFLMGEEMYEVVIKQPFAIARYQVTNAQYQMFIDDGGYSYRWRSCWTDEGWQNIVKYGHKEPYFFNYSNFHLPNQPASGISWYEAVAYARWLRERTGRPYRLPTEAEWERAARHTDGRKYPWGNIWWVGLANSEELDLNRSTAVGVIPATNAYCGAADMAGNVWDCCQTRLTSEVGYEHFYLQPYQSDDGRENLAGGDLIWRARRGGGFNYKEYALKCTFRGSNLQDLAIDDDGFRVVVSPFLPPPGSDGSEL